MEPFECTVALDGALPASDDKIALLHRYWRSITPAGGLMPGRQHFDPTDIPSLLPTLRLYDVHRDPWRFKYRLVGTELVRIMGRDTTGTWFHDNPRVKFERRGHDNLVFVAEGRGLCYRRGFPVQIVAGKDHVSSERILLPLARNGRDVDIILGLSIHQLVPSKDRPLQRAFA
jgi:PAS domain